METAGACEEKERAALAGGEKSSVEREPAHLKKTHAPRACIRTKTTSLFWARESVLRPSELRPVLGQGGPWDVLTRVNYRR